MFSKRSAAVAIAAVVLALVSAAGASATNNSVILMEFFARTDGFASTCFPVGWNSTASDPCADSWSGVTCTGSAVTGLSLQQCGLVGTLDRGLARLTQLQQL